MPAIMTSLRKCIGFAFIWSLSIKETQMLHAVTHPVLGGTLRSCDVRSPHLVKTQRTLSIEPLMKGGNYDAAHLEQAQLWAEPPCLKMSKNSTATCVHQKTRNELTPSEWLVLK